MHHHKNASVSLNNIAAMLLAEATMSTKQEPNQEQDEEEEEESTTINNCKRRRGRRRCNNMYRQQQQQQHQQLATDSKRPMNLKHSHLLSLLLLITTTATTLLIISLNNNNNNNNNNYNNKNEQINQLNYRASPHIIFADAFNVDVGSVVVQRGPVGSYFGYSVALHKDRGTSWLLVGAPKAQTDQPGVEKPGAVYRCTVDNSKACQQIPFDQTGSATIQVANEIKRSDNKSNQWFGASLQSSGDSGFIVACAPRYVYTTVNLKRRDPVGTCWVSRGSFSGFLEYSPCRQIAEYGHLRLGYCQAGFSSAITKDGQRLMIGAPGAHVWQGQVYSHNLVSEKTISTNSPGSPSEDDSYLGYSMTLGHFSSSQEPDVAIGMPRGAELLGKIVVTNSKMNVLHNITGEQMGSYFGYSIVTADVNGDGLDDLVVGAPLFYNTSHKEPHYERGRVYVVLQNMRHEFTIKGHIDGLNNRARFGSALANCGDLNKDGYQDIAVGAPYDGPNNHGAIYIFNGGRSGLDPDYDQVIYAEDIKGETGLSTFGFSLSGGLDLDNNNYPDLLVGDYNSDRAFFFKTRPIVNVTTSFRFEPENFNLDDRRCVLSSNNTPVSCINVQYCVKYNGYGTDQRLEFAFKTKLDSVAKGAPRLFFLNNEGVSEDKYTQMLTKDVNTCKSFKAYLMKSVRDKLTPLQIDVDYNLVEPTYRAYVDETKLRPVLNKAVPNKLTKIATIQKNCGPDNVCVPDLKLSINPNIDQYTIGSAERLVLDVNVKNYGEDAFESMFFLNMPHTINYITINKTRPDQVYPICYGSRPDQTGVNTLTCELGNPQVAGEAVKFSILTEPARGVFSAPDFTFVANVNSTNPESERNREDNQVAIGIPIRVQVDLTLSGNSAPALVVHNSTKSINAIKDIETDIGPEVYHIYQLQNRGPSTINDIAITILWPTMNKDGRYLLYLVDEPLTSEKVKCKPAPANSINPMNLKYQRGNFINSQYVAPSQNKNNQQDTVAPIYKPYSSRQKRQVTTQTPTTTVDNSILQNLNLLSCGPTQCTRFECNVFNLGNNEIVHIRLRSRLFEETLNYISIEEFDISSKLVAQVKSLPYNVSSDTLPPYTYSVITQVHTTGLGVQDLLPSWVIIVSILAGILLFILLALFLRWLGFFARKRPPKSGMEREPLTPSVWNDYHYQPGDTAL